MQTRLAVHLLTHPTKRLHQHYQEEGIGNNEYVSLIYHHQAPKGFSILQETHPTVIRCVALMDRDIES